MGKTYNLNRRDFFCKSAKIAAASTLGLATLSEKSVATEQKVDLKLPEFIIDSHIHCGGSEEWFNIAVGLYQKSNEIYREIQVRFET